jgi:hypothetical protein
VDNSKYNQIFDIFKHLRHPEKFKGRRPITLRSSWEIKFVLRFIDIQENILEWKNEDIIIPYFFEIDRKWHRYFPDFWIKFKDKYGNIRESIIEIKPIKDTILAKNKKNFETFIKNKNKFESAELYCKNRKIDFMILTEKELF